jgi:uncharacterized membrane protein YciS (DUF1049 family)
MKQMKLPSGITKLLTNKYVLYFVLFLAVVNILGYGMAGNNTAVIFIFIVGYIVSRFSNNMIIILGVPVVLASFLMIGNTVAEGFNRRRRHEGMANKGDTTKPTTMTKGDSTVTLPVEEDTTLTTSSSTASEPTNDTTTTTTTEDMNVLSRKNKNRIDYGTTLENAYGDLNNILGGEGIKKLTEDTQRLMKQQLELADAMKGMAPLMENAKSMLQGFDLKNLGGLADLAKTFNASPNPN